MLADECTPNWCTCREENGQTNAHQSSFFPHTIALWNSLPPSAQNCQSLHSFKQTVLRHTLNTQYLT